MEASRTPITFRRLFRNYLSLVGAVVAGISFATDVFLILVDLLAPSSNPYVGILTYMLLPGVTIAGLGLVAAGAAVRYARLRRGLAVVELPRLDLNRPRHRLILFGSFTLVILFLGLSAVGGYQAYHFTDSVQFCGQTCHSVMNPEFTAYEQSPHARVTCASCHIGPGAEWFVRSKISGAYQIYSVLFDKYSRPIPTPIHNLRPAQETCEQCHWPAKFWGDQFVTRIHYASDEKNTPRAVNLLVKTGGGGIRGLTQGIHWHMNISQRTWYIAADERRQVIPYVRVEDKDGQITEYTSTDHALTPEQRAQGTLHRMDCVDCHNRPSHRFLPPARAVDLSLQAGRISADLPYVKKVAVEAMVRPYASVAEADRGIEQFIRAFYDKEYPDVAKAYDQRLRPAVEEVKRVYRQNFFPEMRVTWKAYPDNIGHKEFPGCFRCHDGKHVSKDGRPINSTCSVCHEFLQSSPTGLHFVEATPAFAHPWKLGGKHATLACSTCHTGGPAKPATCKGCHQIGAEGTPMASLACSQCHQKEQERQPIANCATCHAQRAGLHKAATHAATPCTACHAPHGWAPAARDTCLSCHADKAQHNPGRACVQCHDFRGKAVAGGPPAITFAAGAGSPGPVTFAHAAHLARGATCGDCHPRLFKMHKGGPVPTMDAMAGGKACGACHNGKKAFEVMDGDKCATCHKS
jgi:c(7)-type cytochrome triheme protein